MNNDPVTTPQSLAWHAVYLFLPGPAHEPFLRLMTELVVPVTSRLREEGLFTRFFFIRYPEGGYHVRLRFECTAPACERICHVLEQEYSRFSFEADGFEKRMERALYEPETTRYGGPRGLQLAEKHFCLSSAMALSLKKDAAAGEFSERFSTALAIHLLALLHSGFSTEEMKELQGYITRSWINEGFGSIRHQARGPFTAEDKLRLSLDYFEDFVKMNGRPVFRFLDQVRSGWESGNGIKDSWRDWQQGHAAIFTAFRQLQESGELDCGQESLFYGGNNLYNLYASLMHITNNRMGIGTNLESLLSFILGRYLEQMEA